MVGVLTLFFSPGRTPSITSHFCFYLHQLQAWKPASPKNIIERIVNHDGSLSQQQGVLTGLQKFTQYQIAVVAFTSAGDSPKSDTKLIKTEEGGKGTG